MNDVPTSVIPFVETEHGRMRREQRGIHMRDLQSAMKYGKCELQLNYRRKYTYKNIVYITESSGEEVTSYAIPISLQKVPISREVREMNDRAADIISRGDKSLWKSNTVIVVDTSGSMRSCDVFDTKTRLDAVWISIALDFIAERLESGGANEFDVISLVSMGPSANVIIKEHPTTWVLYNRIVQLYNAKTVQPHSHGNYFPAIDMAEKLLFANSTASCALGLCFISDGRPSDHVNCNSDPEAVKDLITKRVALLAKKFGRRLQFDAVGIGSADEFQLLEEMVQEAADYGANASFALPSLTSSAMGNVLKSFATSMTSTQTEMTCLFTKKQQAIKDAIRESRQKAKEQITKVDESQYYIYEASNVKRLSYISRRDSDGKWRGSFETECGLQHEEASFAAFHKCVFGEGGERLVHRFYELGEDAKTIVGGPLVAKESRFVTESEEIENCGNETKRFNFVETFCKTQSLAARIAEEFNKKLDWLRRVDDATPRVKFLECSVYKMKDDNWGDVSVLVEPRLDEERWKKWNSNNGYVDGMKAAPKFDAKDLDDIVLKLDNLELDAIGEEEEQEEDEGEEEQEEGEEDHINEITTTKFEPIVFTPFDVAQAFSCFSFWATGRKRLICDLQGVFDEKENILIFSDPVIHYHDRNRTGKRMVHGRTDRGSKGIAMFKNTHQCSHLCKLVTGGFKRKFYNENRNSNVKSRISASNL